MIVNPFGFAQGYVESGQLGSVVNGGAAYSFAGGDFKNGWALTVPGGGIWFKQVKLLLQTVVAGGHIRPVIYTGTGSTDTIIAQGQDIALSTLATSTPGSLVTIDFRADLAATFLSAGSIALCIHASGTQIDVKADAGGTVVWNSDTYSDGPSDPYGAAGGTSSRTPNVAIPYSVCGP